MSFTRCKIEISQGSRSIEITLLGVESGYLREGFLLAGRYESAFSDMMANRKGWIFSQTSRELRLIDTGTPANGVGWVGGGLKNGEVAENEPFAKFYNAGMTERGIEPLVRGGKARGWLEAGMASTLNRGWMDWRLSGVKKSGSSAWQTP